MSFRHGALRGFEPGNTFHLDIEPGGSEEVRIGWLGPEFALGAWDGITEPIFDQPGAYAMRMVYRNHMGKALSFGRPPDMFLDAKPWVGEAVSDTATVTVE